MAEEAEPKRQVWLGKGHWTRVREDENWCDICNKSTLWEATTYLLRTTGVEVFGKVVSCHKGKSFLYTNLKGQVTRRVDHEEVKTYE